MNTGACSRRRTRRGRPPCILDSKRATQHAVVLVGDGYSPSISETWRWCDRAVGRACCSLFIRCIGHQLIRDIYAGCWEGGREGRLKRRRTSISGLPENGKSRVSILVKTLSCLAWKHHIVSVFGRNYRAFIRWVVDRFCAPSLLLVWECFAKNNSPRPDYN